MACSFFIKQNKCTYVSKYENKNNKLLLEFNNKPFLCLFSFTLNKNKNIYNLIVIVVGLKRKEY